MPSGSTLRVSTRSNVDAFRAMDVLASANRMIEAGQPVISLAVGQPAAPAPATAIAAARTMLDHGRVGYTDALGRRALRERIALHYGQTYGVWPGADRVMVTTGSSAGFNLAFLAAFDPGDRVAIAAPGYPAYRNILKALGIEPVEIEVGAQDRYVLTVEHLVAAHEARPLQGVLIASPANPTGTITPRDELESIVSFCDTHSVHLISDEIYHGLAYGAETASALEFSDRPIVVNSFSKYYCMTGWRCGWLVLPPELMRAAERIGQNLYISAPDLSQAAALAAFDGRDELEAVKRDYEISRDVLMNALPNLGFSEIAPIEGAFYAYARIPRRFASSSELAAKILDDCHVAMTPGLDFDLRRGDDFMRLSYAGDPALIAEAMRRLERYLA